MHLLLKFVCLFLLELLCHRVSHGSGSRTILARVGRAGLVLISAAPWLTKGSWSYMLIPAFFLILESHLFGPHRPRAGCRIFSSPLSCRGILAATGVDAAGQNILPGVQSRAAPNKRLRFTFGVENSFTTLEEEYCQRFRNSAARKLRLNKSDWDELAKTAGAIVRDQKKGKLSLNLVQLVQLLSLKISMVVLFRVDATKCNDQDMHTIASEINRLWLESKDDTRADGVFWRDEGKLARALSAVLPEFPQGFLLKHFVPKYRSISHLFRRVSPRFLHHLLPPLDITSRTNPLNYILPAYETLWRVVLKGFLEVGFRHVHLIEQRQWTCVLRSFVEDPSMANFQSIHGGPAATRKRHGFSVESLVIETLRLYPPTRRIYRKFQYANSPEEELVAADIETCQRLPNVWGTTALQFDPREWRLHLNSRETPQLHRTFMPFGAGHFQCPAGSGFGPRMIGLLVGVLVTQFTSEMWKLESKMAPGRDEPIDRPDPLHSGRHAFTSYDLVRKFPGREDLYV
ncbi:MAG: hypothetical protein M1823_002782 [Watsoniomyces obsoletus]|nr:MAG: hypothetical protein M1823_002782 [Watsoniomyces obsoletus]